MAQKTMSVVDGAIKMKKNMSRSVKNPLSVIGIFASISEISMTVTIIKIPEQSQNIFIWFVMLFPLILVVAFFFVLYTKPAVLFSPSDYQEDQTYLSSIRSEKGRGEINKRLEQLEEVTSTLQSYVESVAREVTPDKSISIIKEQEQKLAHLKKLHELEDNRLFSFLYRDLDIKPEQVIEIINRLKDGHNLPKAIEIVTKDVSKTERVERIINRFPKVLSDLDLLKTQIGA
ncbi:MAG: hypothetical protein MUP16_02170 [Sedimentisphaerales bacterium]|nr:hypothetical protein [Sedimentisphaerales bacterium]